MERESELTRLSDVMGAHRMRHGWPPEVLAPGVTMVPRRHQKRDDKTQEPAGTEVYLAPQIEDSRLYYAHLVWMPLRRPWWAFWRKQRWLVQARRVDGGIWQSYDEGRTWA